MKTLYVDNFRGFFDTYIPCLDVNFLVGENSTGKTSILSILNLLCDMDFWLRGDFNTETVELGTFRDIASSKIHGKKYFRVGMIRTDTNPKDSSAFLLTFAEQEALPVVSHYDYYTEGTEINIAFSRQSLRYKYKERAVTQRDELFDIFRNWTKMRDTRSGYTKFQRKYPVPRRNSLINAGILIESEIKRGDDKDSKVGHFSLPYFAKELVWLAPIRTTPKRTYDSFKPSFTAEGSHTPYLIRDLLTRSGTSLDFKKYLKKYGSSSSLLDSISTKDYGSSPTSPFSLNVILKGRVHNIMNVGYGVSQILPIVVELFAREPHKYFAIQQPEIHLHPKAQAALGDVIWKLAKEQEKKFLIETHSDYIIDRFRINASRKGLHMPAQVLFFEKTKSGNKVTPIKIMENGYYDKNQPKAFREFFIKEELRILRIR